MPFTPNKKFKKKYNRLFNQDPVAANIFLLITEMADENGRVVVKDESEIAVLLTARFEDPREYAL